MGQKNVITIRPLDIEDYLQVREVWREVFDLHPSDSLTNTREFIRKNPELSFVATIDGKVVGVILTSYNGRIGYMCRLAVMKKYQKRGLGKKLIKRAEEALQKVGAKQAFLYCKKNLAGLYRGLGYRVEKDCLVMIKDL